MIEIPPTAGLPLRWHDLLPSEETPQLAQELSALLDVPNPLITCSGTAALLLAVSAMAADSDRREVVVPAYTCPLVAIAVAQCGLTLRTCDVKADGAGMDVESLATVCGPDTLAIVPTYLGGRVHDIQPVLDRAAASGARVIEDAAQAMGARHADGSPVGMRGDVGFYSLAVGKGLTMFEGGVLVSRDGGLRVRLRDLAATTAARRVWWELRRSIELIGYAAFYTPGWLPIAYGIPLRRALRRNDPEAAAGDVVPMRVPVHSVGSWRQGVAARAAVRWPAHRMLLERQATERIATLSRIRTVRVLDDVTGARGTWPVLTLLMPDGKTRDAVLGALWGAGVGVGVPFARALPDYAGLRGIVPLDDVPNARGYAARVLTITNSTWLDDETFAHIVQCIEAIVSGHTPSRTLGTTSG